MASVKPSIWNEANKFPQGDNTLRELELYSVAYARHSIEYWKNNVCYKRDRGDLRCYIGFSEQQLKVAEKHLANLLNKGGR